MLACCCFFWLHILWFVCCVNIDYADASAQTMGISNEWSLSSPSNTHTHTRAKQLDNLWYFFLLERSKSTFVILPSFFTKSKYNCFRTFSSECGINAQTQCEKRQLFQICWNKKHPQANTSRKLILNFYTILKPAFSCHICLRWQIRLFVSVHHEFFLVTVQRAKEKLKWIIDDQSTAFNYCITVRVFFELFFLSPNSLFLSYSYEVNTRFYAC